MKIKVDESLRVWSCKEKHGNLCFVDPRNKSLGYRVYEDLEFAEQREDLNSFYTKNRLLHNIPEFGVDFFPDQHFALDLGMNELNAISFYKGCYIGQEVVAKMFYRGKKKSRVVTLKLDPEHNVKDRLLYSGETKVGEVLNTYDDKVMVIIKERTV